jgi:hypothetical protein
MNTAMSIIVFLIALTLLFTYPKNVKGCLAGAAGRAAQKAYVKA